MKRLRSFILIIFMLCLTACTPGLGGSVADTYPPAPSDSTPRLTQWENTEEDAASLSWMYHMGSFPGAETVTLTRVHTDGSTSKVTVCYDGTVYHIQDSTGTRSYSHLLHTPANGGPDAGFDYAEYFLLSNDPEITAQAFSADPTADAEVLFAQYLSFDRADCYGNVPPEIQKFLQMGLWGYRTSYFQDSFLVKRSALAYSSLQNPVYLLERYDYAGNLLCQISLLDWTYNALELTDGGLAISTYGNHQAEGPQLLCYDKNGKLRWEYDFCNLGDHLYTGGLFQRGDNIYLLGVIYPNSNSDIYAGCFSLDGTLLREQIFSGSDFESISRVTLTDEGFQISGQTQSGDGPFPFSKDGYGVDFTAMLSEELEISKARKSDTVYARYIGMHKGQTVYSDDPIVTPIKQDQLTEDASAISIFDFADGYVIVRAHRLAFYPFQNPVMSHLPSYTEMIATYYDANGQPVWQGVGMISVE